MRSAACSRQSRCSASWSSSSDLPQQLLDGHRPLHARQEERLVRVEVQLGLPFRSDRHELLLLTAEPAQQLEVVEPLDRLLHQHLRGRQRADPLVGAALPALDELVAALGPQPQDRGQAPRQLAWRGAGGGVGQRVSDRQKQPAEPRSRSARAGRRLRAAAHRCAVRCRSGERWRPATDRRVALRRDAWPPIMPFCGASRCGGLCPGGGRVVRRPHAAADQPSWRPPSPRAR